MVRSKSKSYDCTRTSSELRRLVLTPCCRHSPSGNIYPSHKPADYIEIINVSQSIGSLYAVIQAIVLKSGGFSGHVSEASQHRRRSLKDCQFPPWLTLSTNSGYFAHRSTSSDIYFDAIKTQPRLIYNVNFRSRNGSFLTPLALFAISSDMREKCPLPESD